MSANHDLERRLTDHYEAEAPPKAPAWVLERALTSVETTAQRRTIPPRPLSWRSRTARFGTALAAVAVLGVAVVGLTVSLSQPDIGTASPTPDGSPTPATSPSFGASSPPGYLWPQRSLEEIRAAQARADARDPDYVWQLIFEAHQPQLGQHHPRGAEQIFSAFIEEVLGWEAYLWDEAYAHPAGIRDRDVVYLRCAPGRTNPVYPAPSNRPDCAPTIDDFTYETATIHLAQPATKGANGIWAVTRWTIGSVSQAQPRVVQAEATALLSAFLAARVNGAGAEGFVDLDLDVFADDRVDPGVPLLYATSGGDRYERTEFEIVEGPRWPDGSMRFRVRLFGAGGGPTVEQFFAAEPDDTSAVRLVYDYQGITADGRVEPTTEDGKTLPATFAFLDGAVTYRATWPVHPSLDGFRAPDRLAVNLMGDDGPRQVLFVADPRPLDAGCAEGERPANAEGLARSIASDSRLVTAAPVGVTIGGVPALQLDMVLAPGAPLCSWVESDRSWSSALFRNAPFPAFSDRARLILVDLPEGSGARVLAIAVITDEDSFEGALGLATPVLESVEIQAP